MKLFRILLLMSIFMSFVGSVAQAALITLPLNEVYTGQAPDGTAPWAVVTLVDDGVDTVNVRVDHLTTSAAESGRFISEVYFNLMPYFPVISVVPGSMGNAAKYGGTILNYNNIYGGGGDLFDLEIDFGTSNAGGGVHRLKQGEFWSADYTAPGLNAMAFVAPGNKGHYVGSHFQGLLQNGSGHVAAVPEPASFPILAFGLLALRRRRR